MQTMNKYNAAQFVQTSLQKHAPTHSEYAQPARTKSYHPDQAVSNASLHQYKRAHNPLASELADVFGLE